MRRVFLDVFEQQLAQSGSQRSDADVVATTLGCTVEIRGQAARGLARTGRKAGLTVGTYTPEL